MGVLIIGDVHGCFYTLRSMVREHWRPEKDTLVLIGDLLNKGPHSVRTFKYWLKLRNLYPQKVILIRGNHEQWYLDNYRQSSHNKAFIELSQEFKERSIRPSTVAEHIGRLPLHFENEQLFVSHAGLSTSAVDPFNPSEVHSLIKNRKPLQRLRKLQIIGHTVVPGGKPRFHPKENAWFIDTGAWSQGVLSALHFPNNSSVPKILQVKTKSKDL